MTRVVAELVMEALPNLPYLISQKTPPPTAPRDNVVDSRTGMRIAVGPNFAGVTGMLGIVSIEELDMPWKNACAVPDDRRAALAIANAAPLNVISLLPNHCNCVLRDRIKRCHSL